MQMIFVPHRNHALSASRACYGDGFIFIYVGDGHIPQDEHVPASTVCYGDSLTFVKQSDLSE
jgi:hypothetical protein